MQLKRPCRVDEENPSLVSQIGAVRSNLVKMAKAIAVYIKMLGTLFWGLKGKAMMMKPLSLRIRAREREGEREHNVSFRYIAENSRST